jgi:hypothetical protein
MSNTKVSKRISQLCQKKYRTPKCQKECQNYIKKNVENQSVPKNVKIMSKKYQKPKCQKSVKKYVEINTSFW